MKSCDEIINKAYILTNVGIFETYITSIVPNNAAIEMFYLLLKLSNLSHSLNFLFRLLFIYCSKDGQ